VSEARGIVIWICGLPSSGKSTLARAIAERSERPVIVLDGDEIRDALVPRPGYDEASRDAFYDTLARLAALAAAQGLRAIVAATANRRAYRERARSLAPAFLEVLVDTPAELCIERDAKGLYRAAGPGSALPGVGVPFERPEAPDIIVGPGDPDAAATVLARVRTLGR
jgi:adenylylsulfate kinase